MPLVTPILDDRSFDDLRTDLIRRIPTYTPEWTNHNETDPGIALLELFAFLGESLLFRFNQIPDRTKVAFLNLLQIPLGPARPARALVVVETDRSDGVQLLKATELKAGAISFETENELYAWPLEVIALGKISAENPDDRRLVPAREDIARRLGVKDDSLIGLYYPTVVPSDPTAPDATPLDVSATIDQALWIAVLRKETTDPKLLRDRAIFVGIEMDGSLPDDPPFDFGPLNDEGGTADRFKCRGADQSAPRVVWELWTGESNAAPAPPTGTPDPGTGSTFEEITASADTTRGLMQSGVVMLTLPPHFTPADLTASSGGYQSPPPLDDPEQAAKVVAWIRVRRPRPEDGGPESAATGSDDNDAIHKVRWVGINAVSVVQARTAPLELLGVGDGSSDQRFRLANSPVLRGTVVLEVEEPEAWRTWEEVETFVGGESDDRHFIVDLASGEVRFGGRGRHPQIGERIRVVTYQYGGGIGGAVPAGSITRVTGVGGVKATNPLPARGGKDAERLDDALDRIPAELLRRDRAVTEGDFKAIAGEVPGVARAETLLKLHPDSPLVDAAGVVTVVIFPKEDVRNPAAPMPDLPLLQQVCSELDLRRLLTTELYVIPPTYRRIAVSVAVQVREGYQIDAVRRWVELILRQYLAPLPPHGPDGAGWPMGRTVRRQELEAVAVQVEGVEYLHELRLAEKSDDDSTWSEQDFIQLARWEVPELGPVQVEPDKAPPPGEPAEQPTDSDPIVAPVPPDVC